MEENIKVFKENSIRITPQRLSVYNLLKKWRGHPTAEFIYSELKKDCPAISLATVYAILELFQRKNLVRQLRINFDKSSFDTITKSHHHFLCRKCGRIFDVDMPPCVTAHKVRAGGHTIEEFQGYFYGLCKDCRKG